MSTSLYAIHGANDLDDYPGWVVLTRGIGADPDDRNGENFRVHRPLEVIVRLNHGYGSQGTIPLPENYKNFAERVAHFVEMSPGCSRWIIGNEPNHLQERPQGQPILPDQYAECFTLCRNAIKGLQYHSGDQVLVAAVAPWNTQTYYWWNESGDWVKYFEDIQRELPAGGCDGFALHTYARAQTPAAVLSSDRMDPPWELYHNGFRTYMDWMVAILPKFQGLPVYITETNAIAAWKNVNSGFVQAAYEEIDGWNRMRPDRPIYCLALYRWEFDQWAFKDKPQVHADFYAAVEHGYTVPADPEDPPEEDDMLLNPGLELPYERDPTHSTVNVAHDWTYFASDGKPPERDGPCQLPEYKSISRAEDPQLVYEGETAQCWFIRWKIFDAGIYQRVEASQGARYTFDAALRAWCTDGNDEEVSDGDMHAKLGIDPAGGVDPWAPSVVWSEWKRCIIDYQRHTSPQVVALADHITVFVRAWNKWELSHNDLYLDDCHLSVEGGGQPGGEVDYERIRTIVREELDKTFWVSSRS